MRRHSVFLLFVLLLVFTLSSYTLAATRPTSGLVTLLAHDDLQSSFSFRTGTFGALVRDSELLLDDAQLVYHLFAEDMLSFGFVRSEFVSILDLGHLVVNGIEYSTDLAPKPPLSIFYTLFFDGGGFKYKGPLNRIYRLSEAQALVSVVPPPGLFHFAPQVGHTYLLKVQRRAGYGDPTPQFFKFLIIDFEPGHRVTFRWGHLR